MRRPLLGLAVAFGLGCLLTDGEAGRHEALVLLVLAGAELGLTLATRGGRWAETALLGAALALGSGAAAVEGLQLASQSLRRVALRAEGRPTRVVGIVRGDALERAGRLVLVIDALAVEVGGRLEACSGRARVEVGGEVAKPRLLDGDRVAVWARLRAARPAEGVSGGLATFGYCKSARLVERHAGGRSPRAGRGPRARSGPGGLRALDAPGHRARSRPRDGPRRPLGGGRGHGRGLPGLRDLPRPGALRGPGGPGGRPDRASGCARCGRAPGCRPW